VPRRTNYRIAILGSRAQQARASLVVHRDGGWPTAFHDPLFPPPSRTRRLAPSWSVKSITWFAAVTGSHRTRHAASKIAHVTSEAVIVRVVAAGCRSPVPAALCLVAHCGCHVARVVQVQGGPSVPVGVAVVPAA
jgi:hypothetical protein